jgi:hypothetical protein
MEGGIEFKSFCADIMNVSITVNLSDGKEKTIPLTTFNQKDFLKALIYDCVKYRKDFLENHKEELPGLTTEELRQRYKQLGVRAETIHEKLFVEHNTPIEVLAHYSYTGRAEPSEVEFFKNVYREWSMLDTEADMIKGLLRKRMGKGNFRRDSELSKAYGENRALEKRLDRTILWFGYS